MSVVGIYNTLACKEPLVKCVTQMFDVKSAAYTAGSLLTAGCAPRSVKQAHFQNPCRFVIMFCGAGGCRSCQKRRYALPDGTKIHPWHTPAMSKTSCSVHARG